MSIPPVTAKLHILNGGSANLLGLVCQFVDCSEVSQTSKTFRTANLLAIAQIFKEKRSDIRLSPKLAEERAFLLRSIRARISRLPQRNSDFFHVVRGCLEKYEHIQDHFLAIHFGRRLLHGIDVVTTTVNKPSFRSPTLRAEVCFGSMMLVSASASMNISTESAIYTLDRAARQMGAPIPVRNHVQEDQWIDRINQNLQKRLISIDSENRLDVNKALNAFYVNQKKLASLSETSREAFQRALRTNAPGSISISLLRFAEIEELIVEMQECGVFSFSNHIFNYQQELVKEHIMPAENFQVIEGLEFVSLNRRELASAEDVVLPLHVPAQPPVDGSNLANQPNPENPARLEQGWFSEFFPQLPFWLRIPLFPVWLSWYYIIIPIISAVRDEIESQYVGTD